MNCISSAFIGVIEISVDIRNDRFSFPQTIMYSCRIDVTICEIVLVIISLRLVQCQRPPDFTKCHEEYGEHLSLDRRLLALNTVPRRSEFLLVSTDNIAEDLVLPLEYDITSDCLGFRWNSLTSLFLSGIGTHCVINRKCSLNN